MTTELPKLDGVAGGAFLLRSPARRSFAVRHRDGIVTLRARGAYATVQLTSLPAPNQLRAEAWRVLQEALDILAVSRRDLHTTHRGEHEYVLWMLAATGYTVTLVQTIEAVWDMSATVGNAAIAAPSTIPPLAPHHPCFRFYRLSQLTDDLFDSYRNAYLALECLVSDEAAPNSKPKESEKAWLKRILGGPLVTAIPGGIDVGSAVDEIYQCGRLPLFHAKTGQGFYVPQGPERERVQTSLSMLHVILASLIHHKFGNSFPSGWGRLSQALVDNRARVAFEFDEVVYKGSGRAETATARVDVIDTPRRFGNLWASIELVPPATLQSIRRLAFRRKGRHWFVIEFPESLLMENVSAVRVELNHLDHHVRAPNPVHTM